MIFDIQSFEGALPLRFGMSPADIARILGPTCAAASDAEGALCYRYDSPPLNLTIRFGGEGETADSFSFGRGSKVCFCGVDFFSKPSAWRDLPGLSSDCHECMGSLVFCDFGISLTGFHDGDEAEQVVTVFPRDAWEGFRPKFKPIELT